ncbi:hypothetical protein WS89_31180 [Burkholderia sp. MSMB1072]|uniref:hypothetical protein n=1 Tax=Burkholderia sp. MSMB1072 TaxID=1637871 RepID=UPI00075F41BF|nr:hypothetical protein [Burkholderia sp. MSMB1072]KVH52901.1 hypothetical protein WS89_31180 [Burkholderia sp. MSMB1072]
MDELNAAPSSTEPRIDPSAGAPADSLAPVERAAAAALGEAGTASSGEAISDGAGDVAVSSAPITAAATSVDDSPAVGGGVDAPSHLLLLDAMLAEIERKIGAGIHLFAHEVTAARDHLAKLL